MVNTLCHEGITYLRPLQKKLPFLLQHRSSSPKLPKLKIFPSSRDCISFGFLLSFEPSWNSSAYVWSRETIHPFSPYARRKRSKKFAKGVRCIKKFLPHFLSPFLLVLLVLPSQPSHPLSNDDPVKRERISSYHQISSYILRSETLFQPKRKERIVSLSFTHSLTHVVYFS